MKKQEDAWITEFKRVIAKHDADFDKVVEIRTILQTLGYGRNEETAAALRVVADMIEWTNREIV